MNYKSSAEHDIENQKKINGPSKLYIGAFIGTEWFYTRLDTCWATPNADKNDATSYEFITSGCPGIAEDDTTIEIFANGVAAQSQFSLKSFQFNAAPEAEIYLHCQVKLSFIIYEP